MWHVGIDENGLGPVLGPLVVTATAFVGPDPSSRSSRRQGKQVGIDDSKATSSFGRMAHAEGIALAALERLSGRVPRDADALLATVSLDPRETLMAPCPARGARPQCWGEPVELPAFGGSVKEGRAALAGLSDRGLHLRFVRSAMVCPRVFNRMHASGMSKSTIDLALFERLLLAVRGEAGAEVCARLGMVGGIRRYPARFTHIGERTVTTLAEQRSHAIYRVEGIGELRFEVGADGRYLPVALASMIGKYVREVIVERQHRFYRRYDPELARASGYRDPVTKRFIARSEPHRRRLRVADSCFFRRA
jgi:ribonuclease HII